MYSRVSACAARFLEIRNAPRVNGKSLPAKLIKNNRLLIGRGARPGFMSRIDDDTDEPTAAEKTPKLITAKWCCCVGVSVAIMRTDSVMIDGLHGNGVPGCVLNLDRQLTRFANSGFFFFE